MSWLGFPNWLRERECVPFPKFKPSHALLLYRPPGSPTVWPLEGPGQPELIPQPWAGGILPRLVPLPQRPFYLPEATPPPPRVGSQP